jgi:G3E family GTPase
MDDFETVDFLTDRHGVDVQPEDERNITDLYISSPSLPIAMRLTNRLTDQIEFANVILLNKTDIMPAETVDRIETIVKTLNPYKSSSRCSESSD